MSTGKRDEPSLKHDAAASPEPAASDGRAGVREAIWTISKSWQSVYFAFFSLQMVLGVSLIFWYHVFEHVEDGIVETLIGIVRDLASVSVGSAGTSYTLAEGARLLMILASNLEQWINKKWDERDARNWAAGLEEGEKRGRAEALAEFHAWNDRRISAESRGELFDEPMPGSDNGSVHADED